MAKNKVLAEGALAADTRKIINDNLSDVGRCSSQLSVNSGSTGTTLQDVTGLVTEALRPGTYRFRIVLITTATANSGLKAALKQTRTDGSATTMLTSIQASVAAYTASGVAVTTFTSTTDAASLVAATSAYIRVEIDGTCVVAAEGTLKLQAAQNASHSDNTTVEVGSHIVFTPIGATT